VSVSSRLFFSAARKSKSSIGKNCLLGGVFFPSIDNSSSSFLFFSAASRSKSKLSAGDGLIGRGTTSLVAETETVKITKGHVNNQKYINILNKGKPNDQTLQSNRQLKLSCKVLAVTAIAVSYCIDQRNEDNKINVGHQKKSTASNTTINHRTSESRAMKTVRSSFMPRNFNSNKNYSSTSLWQ
jgi:hypothetical protein